MNLLMSLNNYQQSYIAFKISKAKFAEFLKYFTEDNGQQIKLKFQKQPYLKTLDNISKFRYKFPTHLEALLYINTQQHLM